MKRTEVLVAANDLVTKDREDSHGKPEDTFNLIARLWSEYLDHQISEVDVAMLMSLLKIARQRGNNAHKDNYIDLAGYAACAAELASASDQAQEEPDKIRVAQPPAPAAFQDTQPTPIPDKQQQYTPGGFG